MTAPLTDTERADLLAWAEGRIMSAPRPLVVRLLAERPGPPPIPPRVCEDLVELRDQYEAEFGAIDHAAIAYLNRLLTAVDAKPCCPHPVERHAYNGCAECGCSVAWTKHPDRNLDATPSADEARLIRATPVDAAMCRMLACRAFIEGANQANDGVKVKRETFDTWWSGLVRGDWDGLRDKECADLAAYIIRFLCIRNGAELAPAFDAMRVSDHRLMHEELAMILAHGGRPPNWVPE